MPTLGAPLQPFLPSDRSEVLGHCLLGQGACCPPVLGWAVGKVGEGLLSPARAGTSDAT